MFVAVTIAFFLLCGGGKKKISVNADLIIKNKSEVKKKKKKSICADVLKTEVGKA